MQVSLSRSLLLCPSALEKLHATYLVLEVCSVQGLQCARLAVCKANAQVAGEWLGHNVPPTVSRFHTDTVRVTHVAPFRVHTRWSNQTAQMRFHTTFALRVTTMK
jgi:hypothetical protein